MSKPFAIAAYPLSSGYRAGIEERLGSEIEVLDLPALRRLGARALLAALRAHRGRRCVLALEDPAAAALLPVLGLLAVVAGSADIVVVDADLRATPLSRRAAVRRGPALARASLDVRVAARSARRELEALRAGVPRASGAVSPRRVLYVNGNLWFGLKAGGSVGHVAGVVNALLDAGIEVDVAAAAPQPLVRHSAGFVPLPVPRTLGLPPELNQYAFSRASTRTLVDHIRRTGADLLYQRLSLGNYAGAEAARATGVPLVVEYNGSEVWVARNWGRPLRHEALALAAEEATLREATLVVTVSDVLGEELVARGVPAERLVVYPNCVDPAPFEPSRLAEARRAVRARLGLDEETVVVTFVGTFGRWHGADVLARVIRRLADGDPAWLAAQRVRFLLVGDGLRFGEVRDILGPPGLAVTTTTGLVPQADAPGYLAASDVLVSPHVPNEDGSRFFGSPTKLFEYMAAAKGIVASELDQIGTVLRPSLDADALPAGGPDGSGELAVLARPGDAASLERGIRFLVDHPDWRQALGANARARVLDRYTWRRHVGAILARVAGEGR